MKWFLRFGNFITLGLIILLAGIMIYKTDFLEKFKKPTISEIIKSDIDFDNDGIDDYSDILAGAKEFISKKPKYKSKYYSGGYPSDEYYVCTDLIWYALKTAGYDFKTLIDEDIKKNIDKYDIDPIDTNIDFRRVRNIKVFLDNNALVLTNDGTKQKEFNPGDIIIYDGHIALVSDKQNSKGIKYIIHHDGYHKYEEDGLLRKKILGHYRWVLNSDKKES